MTILASFPGLGGVGMRLGTHPHNLVFQNVLLLMPIYGLSYIFT